MAKIKNGGSGIQGDLNIPGDPNDPLTPLQKRHAKAYVQTILERVAASDAETKARKLCENDMIDDDLEVMPLPNGGKLIKEVINETEFHYEAPKTKKDKKAKKEASDDEE